jgi:hypothetical protein
MKEGEYKCRFNFQTKQLSNPTSSVKNLLPMIYLDVGQSKVQESKIVNSFTTTGQTINIINTQSNVFSIISTSLVNNSITIASNVDNLFTGRIVYIAGIIGSLNVGYYEIANKISSTEYTLMTTTGNLIYQIDATGAVVMTTNTITVDNTAGLYAGQPITIAGTAQNGVSLGASIIDQILSPTTISLTTIDNTLISGATTTLSITGVNVINNYGFQLSKFIGMAYWNDSVPRNIRAFEDYNLPFTLDVKPTFNQITISILDETGANWVDGNASVPTLLDWVLVLSMELVD